MKHQRQKPYECFPTVLGMILDRKASSVVREILGAELSKESWNYLISNSKTEKFAKLEARIESFLTKRCPWLTMQAFRSVQCTEDLPANTLDLSGIGIMVTRGKRQGHIVAFEHGLVFDSSMSEATPWDSYREKLRREDRSINLFLTKE